MELHCDLNGRGVIVTAAGGSIGSACARAMARCGARLALNDVNEESLASSV
jgi:NAD(P)-dependent dehydrogenase (short-subunit alcohol dehydrogenase family)